jgi:Raffinose synthase or seed imbibition protein Sip1
MLGEFESVTCDGVSLDVERRGPTATRVRLTARADLEHLATGRFARPSVGAVWERAGFAADVEFVGFAFTQFALPVTGGANLDFDFRPAPGLASPRAMSPLLASSDGHVVLLAPIDHFHEQIIAVTERGLMWGWHGDLDRVPNGFATTLGIYEASTATEALSQWRQDLAIDPDLGRPASNPLSTHISYWTDNGAAYWYRTELQRTISESVVDVVETLRAEGVPVRAVELDSWFYPHTTLRPIAEIGYPEEVPPTGAETWTPRADAFPPPPAVEAQNSFDPIEIFADRLGRPPLVLHARHIAPTSSYVSNRDDWWIDDLAAHPRDPAFFRRWFDDAARWGATCIEQDWMLMYWFGVRELRAVPGRAAEWQRALNDHARATGVDLLWCMATPADLMLASGLDRVIAVRTCDDYRFADDPAFLWTWFLTVNRLANVLGLSAFKDCFFSSSDVTDESDAIDGDQHAELEALLAAMSGGPVGIGDRIGRTDRDIVMRTCDDNGRIRRVDRALAVTDECLFGGPARGDGLMWATTTSTAGEQTWTYVVAINTALERRTIHDRFELTDERLVYDWRAGTGQHIDMITVEVDPRDWALFVVCPNGSQSIGDVTKYVTVESGSTGGRAGDYTMTRSYSNSSCGCSG